MSNNEEKEQEPANTPTDKQIIVALRKELIRTQRAYLIEQGKSIAMQMDMLKIEESRIEVNEG